MSTIRKVFTLFLMIAISLSLTQPALASIDWTSMSEEEIRTELQAGQNELLSRSGEQFEVGSPYILHTNRGSFIFTLDNVGIVEADSYLHREYGDDIVVICIRGVCENVDYKSYSSEYISNYNIQELLKVVDQDGFSFEVLDYTGVDDGRYQVCAHTSIGEKRRISLTYIGYTDTSAVTVSIPNKPGSAEFHFD